MAFQYSLQKIVDLKNNERTYAEWLLSVALGKLQDEEATLSELYEERERLYSLQQSASQHSTTISTLMMLQHYSKHVDQLISRKNEDIWRAQSDVTHQQESLSLKMLDEKVWNKAREKAWVHHIAASAKKEQNELDEVAALRHIHPTG